MVERAGGGIVGDVDIRPTVLVEVERQHAQAVGAAGLGDAGRLGDVGKGAVSVVAVEEVLPAEQAGGAAGDQHSFVQARAGLGQRRGG